MNNIKTKTLVGLFWRFMERSGAQIVSFIVSIILARILAPEAYGTVALVTVFTNILQIFVDSGFGNALIQKKDADQLDFSSVFYFNLFFCFLVYLCLYISAPQIADYYSRPDLVPVIRVLGLTVVISALKNVQQAYVSRNMLFKRFFYATLGGTVGAAVIGITMAYLGFGVWALVAQQLFNTTVDTIILWVTVRWRPTWEFSYYRLKGLFLFGWKLLASGLLHTVYTNLRSLIIGKMYSAEDLAFYNKGNSFPTLVVTNINTSINSVLFPAMSSVQDNTDAVKKMTRRSISVSSYIMWPMMIGLAVVAKPLIHLLLTDKWIFAVPYLQIACFSLGLEPLHTANLNAIKALGKSEIVFKLEIIKKTISIMILIFSMRYSVLAIAVSSLVYSVIATVLNASPNRTLLKYSYTEQLQDILPSFALACATGIIVYMINYLHIPTIFILILQVLLGCIIYISLSVFFEIPQLIYILNTVKELKSRRSS